MSMTRSPFVVACKYLDSRPQHPPPQLMRLLHSFTYDLNFPPVVAEAYKNIAVCSLGSMTSGKPYFRKLQGVAAATGTAMTEIAGTGIDARDRAAAKTATWMDLASRF